MEELLIQYMVETNALIQSQVASLKNLETQVGQLANAVSNKPQGTLLSNTKPNSKREGKEPYMELILHSGKEIFLDEFKKLHINISFAKVLEQMPSYVKFVKDILTKKRRLGEYETVALAEECSDIIQNKLQSKLKDPSSFIIPYTIVALSFAKTLSDLGASIVEDVLVKVDKFIFPVDFIAFDIEEYREVPILLGNPFYELLELLLIVTHEVFDENYPHDLLEASSHVLKTPFESLDFSTSFSSENKFLGVLRKHKKARGWTIANIRGINPSICMHKIFLEDDNKATIKHPRRLNPIMKEVVSSKGLEIDKAKIETIEKLSSPTLVKERASQRRKFESILKHYHSSNYKGHFGGDRTIAKVLQSDFMGPFISSFNNYYILLAMDYESKWVEAVTMPTNDAKVMLRFLSKNIFTRFGTPWAILSDEGSHFCNKYFVAFFAKYGVTHKVVTAYHPETNGKVKVSNQEIKKILEKVMSLSRKDWAKRLDAAL
ncbi:Uncharacterized protein TCM_022724 [Theobroma cacao]|uniref:Integrase catalytic domain-containing protein n=1 Tax=Theobroma cacao TaxID=3641 RepID=A0A061F1G6_THECC|nr:Uncharacterized protein TCM_022724 [Theobroma cacao]